MESQKNLSVNLSNFTESSVDKIAIKKGTDEKVLTRKDNVWYIGDGEASADKVGQLFASFSKMKIGEVVSENENNYANFEVNQDAGIQLTISQNGNASLFFVGKAGPAAGEFYIRKDGIKNVYLVTSAGLRELLVGDASQWKKADATTSSTQSSPQKAI